MRTVRVPSILRPLRRRGFRCLWAGQAISQVGDMVYLVALPFQVLALGGGPVQIGANLAVSSAAQVALVLLGGALVDRLPRRSVLLASDLLSALVLGAVALLSLAGALLVEPRSVFARPFTSIEMLIGVGLA